MNLAWTYSVLRAGSILRKTDDHLSYRMTNGNGHANWPCLSQLVGHSNLDESNFLPTKGDKIQTMVDARKMRQRELKELILMTLSRCSAMKECSASCKNLKRWLDALVEESYGKNCWLLEAQLYLQGEKALQRPAVHAELVCPRSRTRGNSYVTYPLAFQKIHLL